MKKFIYLLTGVAMASSMASCVDTEKPVFHEATSFTINAPALQDQYLATTDNLEDKSTFMLYASQPDYGFAAKCNYGVQVAMDSKFVDATDAQAANYITLTNQDLNSGAMRFRTYDLAVAMCKLLGITNPEEFQNYKDNGGKMVLPVYFRGVCEIPGVKGSYIVSKNVVSYQNVQLSYAVPVAGKIFIVGNVSDWKEPSAANAAHYANYCLVEPEIGSKMYAGTFLMPSTESVASGKEGVDYTTQWRFFTELKGWADASVQVASAEADFFITDVTPDFNGTVADGGMYTGSAVYGKGNWGVNLAADTEMTIVVSLQVKAKPKVWFKYGKWDVSVGLDAGGMNEPVFTAPQQ